RTFSGGNVMGHRWYAAVVLAVGTVVTTGMTATSPEEAAIRDVEARQASAWNRHDAGAYADLFTVDGDVVNVLGWWWRGRAEIQGKLTDAFAWIFRDSTLTIGEVHVRFLDP